jgi:hypothetical protein
MDKELNLIIQRYYNVTVYATNEFENTGSSETITVSINMPLGKEDPFPIAKQRKTSNTE